MLRNVYLEGELGDKFIPYLSMDCETPSEVFTCLNGNFPNFKNYLVEKYEQNIGFHIEVAGESLEDPLELLMNINKGDIIVTPIPAGSKSGPIKILAAIAITLALPGVGAAVYAGSLSQFTAAYASSAAFSAAAGIAFGSTWGLVALGVATNLALTGLTEMMAPDPSTDSDQEQSYLFNGAEQNIIEGDPVPVLYGKLRVPGQPISFELAGVTTINRSFGGAGQDIVGGGGGIFDQEYLENLVSN